METQDVYGVKRSISNMCSDIILEPDINMDTSDITITQKRQRNQQQEESKWRHKGIKRSHKEVPFVSYEELEDNLDDLDQPNQWPARTMQYHDRGRKTNSSYPGTIGPGLYSPIFQHSLPPPFVANKEAHSKLRCKLSIAKFPISKYVNHVLQLTHSIYVDYITLSYPYCDCFTSLDAVIDTIHI